MIPYVILAIEDDDDREFIRRLYITYERLMYSEIYKIVRDNWATEDVLQDTIIKLIAKTELLRQLPEKKRINYVISASKNTAYTYAKRKMNRDLLSIEELDDNGKTMCFLWDNVEENLILQDDLKQLFKVWSSLDDRTRYLLEARYVLEKSAMEISKDLGIKPGSVRMALTRARKSAYELILKMKT